MACIAAEAHILGYVALKVVATEVVALGMLADN